MRGLGIILSLPTLLVMMMLTLSTSPQVVKAQLLIDFYAASCPKAEAIVTAAVQASVAADQFMPAKLLRLFFHDCFVDVPNSHPLSLSLSPTSAFDCYMSLSRVML